MQVRMIKNTIYGQTFWVVILTVSTLMYLLSHIPIYPLVISLYIPTSGNFCVENIYLQSFLNILFNDSSDIQEVHEYIVQYNIYYIANCLRHLRIKTQTSDLVRTTCFWHHCQQVRSLQLYAILKMHNTCFLRINF